MCTKEKPNHTHAQMLVEAQKTLNKRDQTHFVMRAELPFHSDYIYTMSYGLISLLLYTYLS